MIPRSEPQATVQRWEYADGKLPELFHRVRNEALFADAEWDWSKDLKQAYHFHSYQEADEHAQALRKEGVEHVHAVVASPDAEILRERDARHLRTLTQTEASIPPEEVFAREERRHLA